MDGGASRSLPRHRTAGDAGAVGRAQVFWKLKLSARAWDALQETAT